MTTTICSYRNPFCLQTIYFDEAGYTGNKLLDPDQPYFVYASVALDESIAHKTVSELKKKYHLQGDELKGKNLVKHGRGQTAIEEVFDRHLDVTLINVFDKQYSLACKFFEYTFEPILSSCSSFYYGIGFNKYIANMLYLELKAKEGIVEDVFGQFERIMRTGNCSDLQELLDPGGCNDKVSPYTRHILLFLAIFEKEIREEIEVATNYPDGTSWVLELSTGAVFNMLRDWGQKFDCIRLICDESKPLKVHEDVFDMMIGRKDKEYIDFAGVRYPLTFNLAEPIKLEKSHTTPGLQIADIIASATARALRNPKHERFKGWLSMLEPYIGSTSVITDLHEFRFDKEENFINSLLLEELLDRAAKQKSMCTGIDDFRNMAYQAYLHYANKHKQLQR